MRILTVGNRYPPWSMGGYEVVWSAAVAWLRNAGHSVRVLTTRPDPSDRRITASAATDVHRELRWYWRNHEFPEIGLRATIALERSNTDVLACHLAEFAPDVVCWWAMGGMSLSLLEQARRAGVGAVGAVGDEWMVYGPAVDAWTARWRGPLAVAAGLASRATGVPTQVRLDRAARWLFTSRYLLDRAREQGWSLPGARVLAHGIDSRLFNARATTPWRWRLCYCGRLDPRKGVDTVLRAMIHLPQEATLTIHGSGDEAYAAELRRLAADLAIGERVRFQHSEHDQMPHVYAQADVVVFPVRWREPWGLVPLEAMGVGRPVVATRAAGGPSEYLQDGRNCLQFDVDDPEQLARAIQRLAAETSLRGKIVEAGHQTASMFTDAAFHQGLEQEMQAVRR